MASLLIVDDTVETCTMLQRLFARCGHETKALYGGHDVVDALRTAPYDLVLLDVMMPQVDGFEVLRAIRSHDDDRVARTNVAMYSAISDPVQMERGLAWGANEWIVKGTPFALLRQRLDRFLAPPEGTTEADRSGCT